MAKFKTAKSGDRIKASEWNAVRKAVFASDEAAGTGKGNPPVVHQAQVMNDQPQEVPAFGVLSVTGPIRDDNLPLQDQAAKGFSEWVRVKAGVPSGEENKILCILQRAALPTHFQPAILIGPTPAWVYINDTEHKYAQAIEGNVQRLESAETGTIRLIHLAAKEGLQLLPVLLGSVTKTAQTDLYDIITETVSKSTTGVRDVPDGRGRIRVFGKSYDMTTKNAGIVPQAVF